MSPSRWPLVAGILTFLAAAPADAQIVDRARLVAALDSAARAHVADTMVPGVSVAVVRGGDTLLLRGYGLVDLEWDVPTPVDASASYEIGSVTKQFTAAAVLKLVEEGKLDLDADLTEYLPGFDTQGHRVPLRRLLDHTSGIRSYTEMASFGELRMRDLPRDTLVALVEAEPFDFTPGEALIYNNSAYFLLGLIIEKASGRSYEEYVEAELFRPLGMADSYYCSEVEIREKRAHGYDRAPGGLIRARYLDHTWPYAAGSLCSSARDLVRWNRALHGGEVVGPSSYAAMTTSRPLTDGTRSEYAMGLVVGDRGGARVITHGGGINGFVSDAAWYPGEELLLVVLQNSTGAPAGRLLDAFEELVLGPEPEPAAVEFEGELEPLVGTYRGPARGRELEVTVTRDGDDLLISVRGQPRPHRAEYMGDGVWRIAPGTFRFIRDGDAPATAMRVRQGVGLYLLRRLP